MSGANAPLDFSGFSGSLVNADYLAKKMGTSKDNLLSSLSQYRSGRQDGNTGYNTPTGSFSLMGDYEGTGQYGGQTKYDLVHGLSPELQSAWNTGGSLGGLPPGWAEAYSSASERTAPSITSDSGYTAYRTDENGNTIPIVQSEYDQLLSQLQNINNQGYTGGNLPYLVKDKDGNVIYNFKGKIGQA